MLGPYKALVFDKREISKLSLGKNEYKKKALQFYPQGLNPLEI